MPFFNTHQGQQLLAAVQRAGSVLLHYRPSSGGNQPDTIIHEKSDGSLVSTADLESNEVITATLKSLFPHELIFSEEEVNEPQRVAAANCVWIIDPLDGTAAFLAGRDDFSILVARCDNKCPTVGLMFFPARDLLIKAEQGVGVTANGAPLAVSSQSECGTGRVYIRNWQSARPELASPAMDSGLALYKVAAGELEGAVIRMLTHKEWDIAAPIVAIKEAGGRVTDEHGRELAVGQGEIAFQYLVASNGSVHDDLLKLIASSSR